MFINIIKVMEKAYNACNTPATKDHGLINSIGVVSFCLYIIIILNQVVHLFLIIETYPLM